MSLRKSSLREAHSEVDTGPLNDILFILLMFFLMISTLANPNVIRLSLPRSKSDTKSKQTTIVTIKSDNTILLNNKPTAIENLPELLKVELAKPEQDTAKLVVVIHADSSAQWGKIVEVMKISKKLGATTSATVSGKD